MLFDSKSVERFDECHKSGNLIVRLFLDTNMAYLHNSLDEQDDHNRSQEVNAIC